MPIFFGTRMMGKVDAIPGLGHVATRFFYLQFIPLVPTESLLIFREEGEQIYGVPIPLSFKSMLVAWMRTAFILGAAACALGGFLALSELQPIGWISLLGCLLLIGAFIYSYYFGPIAKAGYERAMHLARHAGVGAEQMLMLEVTYGRMTADQADQELARLYEAAQRNMERMEQEEVIQAQLVDPPQFA